MALYGPDIPLARSPVDNAKRRQIFDIVAPYTMSTEDVQMVDAAPQRVQDLWLESFPASLKGMLFTSLQKLTKDEFGKSFPAYGAFPAPMHAEAVGLAANQTILDR